MGNRQAWQLLLWFLAGALIGFGLLAFDVFFIFIPCVIVGLCLIIIALRRWGSGHLWAAFLGFGVIPTLFLLRDIIGALPTCPADGLTLPANAPAGTTFSCGGPIPSTYYILLVCFGIIAVTAGVWPLVRRYIS